MSVYRELIKCGESHLKLKKASGKNQGYSDNFRFNFKNRTITNGYKVIMEQGKILCDSIELSNGQIYDLSGPLISTEDIEWLQEKFDCSGFPNEIIKVLYENYRVSVPSRHTVKGCNFIAIDEDELSLKESLGKMKRETALFFLEGFILFGSIENIFVWDNPKHYYLKLTKNLFLFRDWITN